MSDREAFLAGDRPDDVFMYFAEDAVSGLDSLEAYGERVEGGVVLVVEGDRGRSAFERATGVDPMAFAKRAMETEGEVRRDCTGGTCPAAGDEADDAFGTDETDETDDHDARFVFAFAEAQNEAAGDVYAEGDVVHAYVSCSCGRAYSDRWVAG